MRSVPPCFCAAAGPAARTSASSASDVNLKQAVMTFLPAELRRLCVVELAANLARLRRGTMLRMAKAGPSLRARVGARRRPTAKQSRGPQELDCFVASAPRNAGFGGLG